MRLKPDRLKTDAVPVRLSQGPGTYEAVTPNSVLQNAPNYRIGTAQRGADIRNGSPGPGTYESTGEYEGPKWVFGSDKRDKAIAKKDGPGPGTYKEFIIKDPKAYTMSPKHPRSVKSKSPGPGTYNPSLHKDTPLFSIGKGPRANLKLKTEVPGPGTYEARTWTEDLMGPIKFGTDVRRPLTSQSAVPGPGTYTSVSQPGEGPAYSMRSRTAHARRQEVPVRPRQGPGTYAQNLSEFVYESSPKRRFGTSKRVSSDTIGNPVGPGMYDVRGKFIGPKWGFGSSNRSELKKKSESPGPGTYNVKTTVPDLPYFVKV